MSQESPRIYGGNRLCGAKKRNGEPCRAKAMANGRCRVHGGKSLGGLASPSFKTGRYSKYLPARLADKYNEARSDPELLALRDEIALLDTRLEDLIRRVDSGESGAAWSGVRSCFNDLKSAIRSSDVIAMTASIEQLDHLITAGQSDYEAWLEIGSVMEQRRKMVESERKRLVDMQQMITSDRAMLLIGAVVDTVRRNVTDRQALNAISLDLSRLLNQRSREDILLDS